MILAILCMSFGFLAPKTYYLLCNVLALSVPERQISDALNATNPHPP